MMRGEDIPRLECEMLERSSRSTTGTIVAPVPVRPDVSNEYADLKRLIKEKGLLEKQPKYYMYKLPLTLGMFVLSVVFLFVFNNPWFRLLDAVFMAIVLAQIGYLGHDAGHRQIFTKTWMNEAVGLVLGNLIIGMSNSWWVGKHNEHHSHPNQVDLDPDIDLPGISFSEDDARSKRKLERFIMLHQAYFLFPMLLLVALDMQKTSFLYLARTKVKHPVIEWSLMIAHIVVPLTALIIFLGFWQALLFIVVSQMGLGFILGSAFAPNHKGMPILDKDTPLNFLRRQILTSRNIYAGPFTDFWYGGLNYQIEHHLFPSMPRNRLGEAQAIVKDFCYQRDIPYYETGIFRSYKEILEHLHEISTALQRESKASGI